MAIVVVRFSVDEQGRPEFVSDSFDCDGYDRLRTLFGMFKFDYNRRLFTDFLTRDRFSWWSNSGIVRASSTEVMIWDEDSDGEDFVSLTREQFGAMFTDWVDFIEYGGPFSATYGPSGRVK